MNHFFSSDEQEDGDLDSDSDDEQGRHAKVIINGLKSKVTQLQFVGPKVVCPLCPNKGLMRDLQALWQHAKDTKDRSKWY